ncbi:uncharacterized protein [Panulirus ornatus]|uniref:uncharacterized protein isoform X1 n=1 Tax=Panulirus ornatus TaxID=150431 RepID=UPI003A86094C
MATTEIPVSDWPMTPAPVTSDDLLADILNETTPGATPYPRVEVGVATQLTAALVMLVGVVGNLVLAAAFLWRPWGRTPLQVDRVVGLLALTGLATTLVALPTHLYSFATGEYPAGGSLCQVQGFLLNLLCLLCLWYTTVLSVERYVKVASAHEHTLTFSLLNLNVVLSGVLILLLIEVSGPIYGWAEYGYVPDYGVCVLNPGSTHILTYMVIQMSCYVTLPALLTLAASASVLHRCRSHPVPLTRGSQVLKTGVGMSVLCGAVLLCVVLMLPYHALLMLQAAHLHVPVWSKVMSYWLKIVSVSCVYPLVLLVARPREVWPPLLATLHGLKRCRVRGFLQDADGDLDLSSVAAVAVTSGDDDDALRKNRRISKLSHLTDSTLVSSASPSHSTKDYTCAPTSSSSTASVSRL